MDGSPGVRYMDTRHTYQLSLRFCLISRKSGTACSSEVCVRARVVGKDVSSLGTSNFSTSLNGRTTEAFPGTVGTVGVLFGRFTCQSIRVKSYFLYLDSFRFVERFQCRVFLASTLPRPSVRGFTGTEGSGRGREEADRRKIRVRGLSARIRV